MGKPRRSASRPSLARKAAWEHARPEVESLWRLLLSRQIAPDRASWKAHPASPLHSGRPPVPERALTLLLLPPQQLTGNDDSRDTASIRQNILNLVNAGTSSSGTANSASTPSLAQLMGASGQKRTHRINTGMTEQEREETEKLEREMAATRAKWAGKGGAAADVANNSNGPSRGGGMSLASLLTGKTTNRAATAPAALAVSQEAQESVTSRQQVRSPQPESPVVEQKPSTAQLATRQGSPPTTQPDCAPEQPARAPQPSPPADFAPAKSSDDTPSSPRKPTDTLKRLNSSNIVADRLRWSEQIQQGGGGASSPSPSASLPPSPEKRRSVLERWGRDEPNASAAAAVPASPTAVRTRPKSIFDAPAPATASFEPTDKPGDGPTDEAQESTPKLQHVSDQIGSTFREAQQANADPSDFR